MKGYLAAVYNKDFNNCSSFLVNFNGKWKFVNSPSYANSDHVLFVIKNKKYLTPNKDLCKLIIVDHANKFIADVHVLDWQFAINSGKINLKKEIEFSIYSDRGCKYNDRCNCLSKTFDEQSECKKSFKKHTASITGLDKLHSQEDILKFTMYMAMNYSDCLNDENMFWYKDKFDYWLKIVKK